MELNRYCDDNNRQIITKEKNRIFFLINGVDYINQAHIVL